MSDVLVIGIAGGSGSGKTTLTRSLVEEVGDDVTVLAHDSYYRPHHDLTYEERTKLNYDHPDSYETELMVEHLACLRRGEAVDVPVYDFSIHDRIDRTVRLEPSRILIVEGILVLAEQSLRDLMDIKVFVDADADVRVLRRALRDTRERGRSLQAVVDQYLTTVKPMHGLFVEPSKRHADLIVPQGGNNRVALELLMARIQFHLTS